MIGLLLLVPARAVVCEDDSCNWCDMSQTCLSCYSDSVMAEGECVYSQCFDGYVFNFVSLLCEKIKKVCPLRQFSSGGKCLNCPSNCNVCTSSTTCTTCDSISRPVKGTCVIATCTSKNIFNDLNGGCIPKESHKHH